MIGDLVGFFLYIIGIIIYISLNLLLIGEMDFWDGILLGVWMCISLNNLGRYLRDRY